MSVGTASLTVGSLFSGVGGFDIAAERTGMKVLWTSEVDSAASKVLEHRFPNTNHLPVVDTAENAATNATEPIETTKQEE